MSYILEALKKLEQRREEEEPPALFMFSRGIRPERKKRLLWPYLLTGVLLLNAVVMIWWVSERQGGKGEAVTEKAAAPRESPRPAPAAAPEKKDHPQAQGQIRKREAPRAPQGLMPLAPATPGTTATDTPRTGSAKDVETKRPQAQFGSLEENNKRTPGKVLLLNELPALVRGTLPEFNISGHAYSPEPHTRVTRINEKILQEGEDLAPGLKLEEIVPDGVIFSYRGYRFKIDLNISR
jgi:general secretion pathway protein B